MRVANEIYKSDSQKSFQQSCDQGTPPSLDSTHEDVGLSMDHVVGENVNEVHSEMAGNVNPNPNPNPNPSRLYSHYQYYSNEVLPSPSQSHHLSNAFFPVTADVSSSGFNSIPVSTPLPPTPIHNFASNPTLTPAPAPAPIPVPVPNPVIQQQSTSTRTYSIFPLPGM